MNFGPKQSIGEYKHPFYGESDDTIGVCGLNYHNSNDLREITAN